MKRIKVHLNVGFPGTAHEDIIEFDDDASEEEIEEAYRDWKNDRIDGYWEIIN